MQTNITTFLFLLFLLKSFLSYSQTTITNKDFEVSDDVVKIEEVRFKETNDFTENEDYIDLYEFSKGHITGKVRIIENKIVHEVYYNNYNSNEFSYENYNKTYGDYKVQYQVITFNQLKFYYPKTNFAVIQNKPNILFEFSYSIQGRKITRKLQKHNNNYITDTYDDYGYHVDTYNVKGQKVKTETKSLTKSDLFYSSDGLLEQIETIYGKYIDKPHKTYYSYQKDKKGNWFKRVQISLDSDDKIKIAFTSRQITYANGEVSGSIYYDPAFVKWEVFVYSPDLKDDVSKKTKGCISGDCQNGFGKIKYDNGDVYEGNFADGNINGEGYFTWANGDTYKGFFKNNVIEGYGVIKSKEVTYTGYFKNNLPHGLGTKVFQDGRVSKGNFKEGKLNGDGFNTLANGDTVEGNFVEDIMEGFGTYVWSIGNKYVGEFKNGSMEGKGTYFDYTNKKKYEVIYKEGKLVKTLSTTDINTQQVVSSNTLPNTGLYWKKNSENTEVWLYENGVEIDGTVFFVDNTLYFYDVKNNNIYSIQNFKNQTANSYHNATKLPYKYPHGAWMRWDTQGGLQAVNAKGEIIRGNTIFKNAANNIDVIYKGTGETETLFFKGFHNAKIKEVLPAEVYNPTPVTTPTTTTSNTSYSSISNTSSFQTEIQECKKLGKGVGCLIDKITNKYTTLKKSGITDDAIYTKLGADFNAIGVYSPEALFDVIINLDSKILPKTIYTKILAKMSKEQRANLRAYAVKITEEYRKTHN